MERVDDQAFNMKFVSTEMIAWLCACFHVSIPPFFCSDVAGGPADQDPVLASQEQSGAQGVVWGLGNFLLKEAH